MVCKPILKVEKFSIVLTICIYSIVIWYLECRNIVSKTLHQRFALVQAFAMDSKGNHNLKLSLTLHLEFYILHFTYAQKQEEGGNDLSCLADGAKQGTSKENICWYKVEDEEFLNEY